MLRKTINFFKDWYRQWVDYFRMKKIDRITLQLQEGYMQKQKSRIALKKDILDYIMKEFKVNPRSKFIPPSLRRQIVDAVYIKYRPKMDEFGVVMNYNLEFAK